MTPATATQPTEPPDRPGLSHPHRPASGPAARRRYRRSAP